MKFLFLSACETIDPLGTKASKFNGRECHLVRVCNPKTDNMDTEVGPFFIVRFDDGDEVQALPKELRNGSGEGAWEGDTDSDGLSITYAQFVGLHGWVWISKGGTWFWSEQNLDGESKLI